MFKNQLQELAQRNGYNLPSYSCVREGPDHAPRFKSTVTFNCETYDSPGFFPTLRQAEHAAAEVALSVLTSRSPSLKTARFLDESGVCKNLLQETAQRAGVSLPQYTTVRSGPGHVPMFSCIVEIAGLTFRGEAAKTKKQAEKNAAMAAWTALKKFAGRGQSVPLEESDLTDEQEQSTIARALAQAKMREIRSSPAVLSEGLSPLFGGNSDPTGMPAMPLLREGVPLSALPRNREERARMAAASGPSYVPRHVNATWIGEGGQREKDLAHGAAAGGRLISRQGMDAGRTPGAGRAYQGRGSSRPSMGVSSSAVGFPLGYQQAPVIGQGAFPHPGGGDSYVHQHAQNIRAHLDMLQERAELEQQQEEMLLLLQQQQYGVSSPSLSPSPSPSRSEQALSLPNISMQQPVIYQTSLLQYTTRSSMSAPMIPSTALQHQHQLQLQSLPGTSISSSVYTSLPIRPGMAYQPRARRGSQASVAEGNRESNCTNDPFLGPSSQGLPPGFLEASVEESSTSYSQGSQSTPSHQEDDAAWLAGEGRKAGELQGVCSNDSFSGGSDRSTRSGGGAEYIRRGSFSRKEMDPWEDRTVIAGPSGSTCGASAPISSASLVPFNPHILAQSGPLAMMTPVDVLSSGLGGRIQGSSGGAPVDKDWEQQLEEQGEEDMLGQAEVEAAAHQMMSHLCL